MRKFRLILLWSALIAAFLITGTAGDWMIGEAQAKNYLKISKSAIGGSQTVRVGLNKSIVIDLPGDAHDILVANPGVADAITRTSRRIYVFAKEVGSTNIFIFDSSGRQLLSIDLEIERDIAGLERHLEKYIPGSDITVEMLNDNVILTGVSPHLRHPPERSNWRRYLLPVVKPQPISFGKMRTIPAAAQPSCSD